MIHHTADPICPACEDKLREVRAEIVSWFHDLKSRNPSAHISWGHRGQKDQEDAVARGASKLHYPLSAHNKMPSDAVDIFQINESGTAVFDAVFCAGVAEEVRKLGLPLIWGGNFKSLGDKDHFQYNPHADT